MCFKIAQNVIFLLGENISPQALVSIEFIRKIPVGSVATYLL